MKNYFIHIILSIALFFVGCNIEQVETPLPSQVSNPPVIHKHVKILDDTFEGNEIMIIGSSSMELGNLDDEMDNVFWNYIVAFYKNLDGKKIELKPHKSDSLLFIDQDSTIWDIFGNAKSGLQTGKRLRPVNSGFGYWFHFPAKYPDVIIHNGSPPNSPLDNTPAENWLIPINYVVAASGLNAIPSLEFPEFQSVKPSSIPDAYSFIKEDDLVLMVNFGNKIKCYPYPILDYHEIVNDKLNGIPYTVTYCPLAGTAKVFDSDGDNFGVSGLLYNNTLMPFDRATESYWRQLDGLCVHGDKIGAKKDIFTHLEITWAQAKELFEEFELLSLNTGYDRDYTIYPYGNYREKDDFLLFPVAATDTRLPNKEKVFSIIINDKIKVYTIESFF